MFSCTYEVDGYCYLFHCQAKRTQYGCSGSMNSCPNLKELYDYSTMDLKDIRRMQNQASKEADAARAAKKSSQKAGKQSDADIRRQIELDRKNDELARKEETRGGCRKGRADSGGRQCVQAEEPYHLYCCDGVFVASYCDKKGIPGQSGHIRGAEVDLYSHISGPSSGFHRVFGT